MSARYIHNALDQRSSQP